MDKKLGTIKIDFSQLMDLRVDYAFKIFAEGNPKSLISLLNSIFANMKIERVIKSISIKNPYLDKKSAEDNTAENTKQGKIHKTCMIMDIEDFTIFADSLELHYIDMKAFAKAINKADRISTDDIGEAMFVKWLSIITEKEINNKAIIENAVEKEEELMEAVSALARQSEDKYARQAYQRRKDEIYFYNKELQDKERRIEQAERRTEQAEKKIEQAEAENEKLRQRIAALEANQKT